MLKDTAIAVAKRGARHRHHDHLVVSDTDNRYHVLVFWSDGPPTLPHGWRLIGIVGALSCDYKED